MQSASKSKLHTAHNNNGALLKTIKYKIKGKLKVKKIGRCFFVVCRTFARALCFYVLNMHTRRAVADIATWSLFLGFGS
jgi:hypothetical protein